MPTSRPESQKPWGLVLMGGGARGLTHIDVLQALDHAGLTPGVTAGTSRGALVGAFYAAGMAPQETAELTARLPCKRFIDRRLLSRQPHPMQGYSRQLRLGMAVGRLLRGLGANRRDRAEAVLGHIVGGLKIEKLGIPFACNAVDVVSGRNLSRMRRPLTSMMIILPSNGRDEARSGKDPWRTRSS